MLQTILRGYNRCNDYIKEKYVKEERVSQSGASGTPNSWGCVFNWATQNLIKCVILISMTKICL